MSTLAPSERRALPNGVWGIALVIATEGAFFGCIIASYFYFRFRTVPWPPQGIAEPHVLVPLVLTGVLVATSIPLLLATAQARAGAARAVWLLVLTAFVVQSGYLAYQLYLFDSELDRVDPSRSAYGSAYATLLGGHHAHVAVGILLDVWLLARLLTGLTPRRAIAVRVIAWYWHFVNVLAVLVTLTLVSPAL